MLHHHIAIETFDPACGNDVCFDIDLESVPSGWLAHGRLNGQVDIRYGATEAEALNAVVERVCCLLGPLDRIVVHRADGAELTLARHDIGAYGRTRPCPHDASEPGDFRYGTAIAAAVRGELTPAA